MKKRTLFVFLIAGVLLLLSSSGYSLGLIGLGPKVGYFKTADADKGQLMIGAAARLKLGGIGVEGSVDYRQEKYADDKITVRTWPVSATALIYPLSFVYGLAGMGWYNTTIDYDQESLSFKHVPDETKQKIGWHFGAGIELPFGFGKTLAADIRYHFIDYDFSAFPGSKDLKSNFYSINVALLFGL
jgi:opacity protein-like surface antigen